MMFSSLAVVYFQNEQSWACACNRYSWMKSLWIDWIEFYAVHKLHEEFVNSPHLMDVEIMQKLNIVWGRVEKKKQEKCAKTELKMLRKSTNPFEIGILKSARKASFVFMFRIPFYETAVTLSETIFNLFPTEQTLKLFLIWKMMSAKFAQHTN